MDEKDKGLCDKLAEENDDFRKLYEEHHDLKKLVCKMDKKGIHSAEDEAEEKRVKRLKLAVKDKLEKMLAESRQG